MTAEYLDSFISFILTLQPPPLKTSAPSPKESGSARLRLTVPSLFSSCIVVNISLLLGVILLLRCTVEMFEGACTLFNVWVRGTQLLTSHNSDPSLNLGIILSITDQNTNNHTPGALLIIVYPLRAREGFPLKLTYNAGEYLKC